MPAFRRAFFVRRIRAYSRLELNVGGRRRKGLLAKNLAVCSAMFWRQITEFSFFSAAVSQRTMRREAFFFRLWREASHANIRDKLRRLQLEKSASAVAVSNGKTCGRRSAARRISRALAPPRQKSSASAAFQKKQIPPIGALIFGIILPTVAGC